MTNEVTGAVIPTATVEVTIKDRSGVELTGTTWPITLPHILDGTYRATIPDTVVMKRGKNVYATYTADDGVNQRREWCVTYIPVCA